MADVDEGTASYDKRQQINPQRSSSPVMGFAAATAVLETNELLHLVISEVPRENRTSLRRISKSWNAAVVKIGYAFEPIDYEFIREEQDLAPLPIYPPQTSFKPNPAFSVEIATWGLPDAVQTRHIWYLILKFHLRDIPTELTWLDHEFITEPPITHARMDSAYASPNQLLQVRGGIKVGDLLAYFTSPLFHQHNDTVWALFGGQEECYRDGKWVPLPEETDSSNISELDDNQGGHDDEVDEGVSGEMEELSDADNNDDDNSSETEEAERSSDEEDQDLEDLEVDTATDADATD